MDMQKCFEKYTILSFQTETLHAQVSDIKFNTLHAHIKYETKMGHDAYIT